MQPLVSIIVPVYNLENYIERCLDSLLSQSLINIEILIINDGSTDKTVEKVNKIIKNNKNVKLINSENRGPGGARNIGLDVARGRYLSFVDGDDWIDKNMLFNMYNAAEKNNADIVVCDYYLNYGINKKRCKVDLLPGIIYKIRDNRKFFFELGYLTNKIWKKELFVGEKFVEKITYEDLEMIPKIISKAETVIKVDGYYYNYFIRENSITNNNLKLYDKYIALKSLKNELINLKKFNKFRQEYEYLFFLGIYIEAFNKITQGNLIFKDLKKINLEISNSFKIGMIKNKYFSLKYKIYLILISLNCNYFYKIILFLKSLKNLKRTIKYWLKKIYFSKYKKKIIGNIENVANNIQLKIKGTIFLDKDACIYPQVTINLEQDSLIKIKQNASIGKATSIYLRENGYLKIDENSFFNEGCIISGGNIEIGKNVLIAPKCNFIAASHTYKYNTININKQDENIGRIIIKDNVWIGINTTILNNVIIEEGAIIAAGSVVNKNVGKNEIWGGVPAKFIKKRN